MNSDLSCRDVVNRSLYPIDRPEDPARTDVIARVRSELAADGCAVIRGFFSNRGLAALQAEAEARRGQAYYSPNKRCNVYLGEGDPALPPDHPRNLFMPRTNGFVTADLFGEQTISRQFYYWAPLRRFLAECLNKETLFIYDDPVSNMIVNVGAPGQEFNWHYDTNEFTITVLLQAASSGGDFEYVPNLRSQNNECYDEVAKVLRGDRSRVKRLRLDAGDLQFFLGRFSLHRVTENTGDNHRLLLIMSFTEKPGVIGSKVRVRDLYGKTTEIHEQEPGKRVRADRLLD